MSFSTFPRHESFGPSTWSRSVVLKNKKPSIFSQDDREPSHSPVPQPEPTIRPTQKPMHINLTQLAAPSLKSSLRSHSAPTTPTGSKTVKFNPVHLERICLFRKTQTPRALLQDNPAPTEPSFKVAYLNFPPRETTDRSKNILLEKKFSIENNEVKGRVQVRNLAYHKSVSIRYTFDCWQTSHDIDAVYKDANNGQGMYDTFCFTIPLVNLADRGQVRATIDFAIRYHVNGQEFWDNNEGKNYGIQILADSAETEDQDDEDTKVPYRNPNKGLGNRYSFGLSLSQAKKVVAPSTDVPPAPSVPIKPAASATKEVKPTMLVQPRPKKPEVSSLATGPSVRPANAAVRQNLFESYYHSAPSSPTFACQPRHAYIQSTPDLDSESYLDLVNKYCFYGTNSAHTPMPINS
ncbi:putative phosphatase regulatory subunit-domain-containing protein [Phycomyces nitens]|nr:putative phosphatase regulatory subunit-domain-containing protein [Phycomyces nitens]